MPPSPAERKGPRDDRFLLVVPWELNHPGGVNQVVRNLYDGMARRPGLRPWVAVKSWGHPRPRAGRTEGRRTLRLRLREPFPGTGGIKARLLFWLTLPAVLVRLHRWLRRHRVTVVNAHYPGLWLLPVALLRGSGLWQGRLQGRQLLVDGDPQGLKGERRRVEPSTTPPHGLLDDPDQLARGAKRTLLDDGPGNAARLSLLTIVIEDIRQLLRRELVDQVGGGRPARRGIKAHVQRPLGHERETTVGVSELERRQPQIEQDTVDLRCRLTGSPLVPRPLDVPVALLP